jgi:hypothetical protein
MKVRLLTIEQKDLLVGQTYDGIQFFNPTLDADGNWFISNEEVNQCTHQGVTEWVHDLPEIDHNPVQVELPGEVNP